MDDRSHSGTNTKPPSPSTNMSSDILNFNKPCSACRRRKVRCDKAQPCNNCLRHGVTCVYEAPKESVASQQMLQERVERLERMVEDMAAFSLSGAGSKGYRRTSTTGTSPFSNYDDGSDVPPDTGSQVFEPGTSYHMGPDYWMNLGNLVYEPRCMLNINSDDASDESVNWPLLPTHSKQKDISHLHLPLCKEDCLIKLFFEHVDPFIRTVHQGYVWQMVADFRQGTSTFGKEVEALMFAAQYFAAAVLPATVIMDKLNLPKADLKLHLQKATEIALERANVMRSRNTVLFNALLYYITCKFHTGDCEVGSTLLGLASRIARRIGMHRDPAHYGYAAWIVEVRRRLWGHLVTLDAQSCNLEGSDSALMGMGDVQRALNASDSEWMPSRYVGRDPGPRDREGFTDSSCALVRKEVSRTYYNLVEARRTASSCDELLATIEDSEKYVRLKFIHHFDGSDPMHHVITHWFKAMTRSMRITVLYFHASRSRNKLHCHFFEELQEQLYQDCLGCLEDFEQGEIAATTNHWQWAFRWPMPIHVIAGLLSGLARQPDHPDTDRAWEQIDIVFRRYNNDDISMAKIPAWHAIEALCDQAMAQHPAQPHEGHSYTKRVHKHAHSPMTDDSDHLKTTVSPMMLGDMSMYGADMSEPTLSQMFSSTGPAMSMGFPTSGPNDLSFFNITADGDFPSLDI